MMLPSRRTSTKKPNSKKLILCLSIFFIIFVQKSFGSPFSHNLDPSASDDGEQNDVMGERRHRHHRRHHGKGERVNLDDVTGGIETNSMAKLQREASYVELCEQGDIQPSDNVTWRNTECQTCRCVDAIATCDAENCPSLECEYPVTVEGECCQMCPEKLCEASDGRRFRDGAEWHLDDCTYCECRKGRVLCSVEDCEWKSCSNAVKVPGKCCPVCSDSSCHGNVSDHDTGTVWKEGECTHCYCSHGEKKCAEEKCPHVNCTNAYRRPGDCCYTCPGAVQCVLSTWGTWGQCPIQTCGGGMTRRYRGVVIPPSEGGSFCHHMSEAKMCRKLPCDNIPVCPVSEWNAWSHCTATCGTGRKLRMRTETKVTKATMTSLIDCSNTSMQESISCYTGTCNIDDRLLEPSIDNDHCLDRTWSAWGPCSEDCGLGVKTRRQELINSTHPNAHFCQLLQETDICHGKICDESNGHAVNCKVTKWSAWTPCSATCGRKSVKTKHRSILKHPSIHGRQCPRLEVAKKCRKSSCPEEMLLHRSMVSFSRASEESSCVLEDGTAYANGDKWDPEECTSCSCDNGEKRCDTMGCPVPLCTEPIKFDGFCCPFCL